MSDVRPTNCPYCSEPAIFDARKNVILCENCDAEYKVTKQGGAKVKKTGVFEDHEERIQALEHPMLEKTDPEEPEELEPGEAPEQPNEEEEIFPE